MSPAFRHTFLAIALGATALVAPAAAGPKAKLSETADGYVLDKPFADFYDTAFVWTDGGKDKPRVLTVDQMADRLVGYDVIFFGENHRHPGVHLQQHRLFRALTERFPNMTLSMEQFERDTQGVVDAYLAGKVGENALTNKETVRAWDNYLPSYRPMVQYAKDNKLPVIAAEAPVWQVVCVGQWGPEILEKFTKEERAWTAAELNLMDGPYKDKYMKFASGNKTHGGGGDEAEAKRKAELSFAGQVARDDTMAESIWLHLQKNPGRKVMHLDGNFHSESFLGTVERLKLRDPKLKIAVIDPVEVEDLAKPGFKKDAVTEGTVLQLIYPNPESFVKGEDMSAWIKAVMAKRKSEPCKYTLDK